MKRFAPGCYYDLKTDAVHIVADELLIAAGYEPTAANLEIVRQAAREVFANELPGVPVIERGFTKEVKA